MLAGELLLPLDRFGFLARLGATYAVRPESRCEGLPLSREPFPTGRDALESGRSQLSIFRKPIVLTAKLLLPLNGFGFSTGFSRLTVVL